MKEANLHPRFSAGVTLVELILTLLLIGIIGSSFALTFIIGLESLGKENPKVDILHCADLVLKRVYREPRLAARIIKAEPLELKFSREKDLCAGTDQGVFLYDDTSASWTQINGTAPDIIPAGISVYSLIQRSDGRLLAAGSDGYVYYSDNLGTSWTGVKLGDSTEVFCLKETADESAIYAGTSLKGDVYKSVDGGESWNNTANLIDTQSQEATIVYKIVEDSGGSIFASTDGTGNANIFKSEDNGTSWVANAISSIPPNTWPYRKAITITNQTASALTDYQILFNITYIDGKMNSDFSDVRWTDGSSPGGGDYKYWISTYTASTSAKFFVLIPSIPASGSVVIYMYYGNASASSNSDRDSTMDVMEVNYHNLRRQNSSGQWRDTVSYTRRFVDPVVIAQPDITYTETDELVLRIRNVINRRFELKQQEPSNRNDRHQAETISWIAIDPGCWLTPDGDKIEARKYSTNANLHAEALSINTSDSISFATSMSSPVVFSQVMSYNDSDFVKTRQYNVTSTGFRVGMENEGGSASIHGVEQIGWMAFESAAGTWDTVPYEIGTTPDSVTHNWYTLVFAGSYSSAPFFTAWMQKRDGGDSAGMRCSNLTTTSVSFKVEEDTTYDSEVNHTGEVVGYIAVGQTGNLPIAKCVYPEPTQSFGLEECVLTVDTDITALAIAQTGVFYAGTEDGAVYKSTTSGESWTLTATLPQGRYVYSITENWRGYIYAGGIRLTAGAIYRSDNEGTSWTIPSVIPVDQVREVCVSNDQTLLAGTSTGGLLYRSVDSGDNWTALPAVSGALYVYSAITAYENTEYYWTGTPYFPGEDPANFFVRIVIDGSTQLEDGYLTNLSFNYYKKDGTELTAGERATQSGRDTIKKIVVTITLTKKGQTVTRSTSIYMLNN
ncbi:MAG: DUF2341 domain-containing protein [Planctomycetota bacterium]